MMGSEAQVTVSIVIPTWERRELVLRLLELLERQTVPPYEVIVVDNGSTDGTADAVSKRATVIRLTENLGFAAAVNRGIAAAQGNWIGVVNNDIEPREDWLELLLKSKAMFVTGKLLDLRKPELLDGTFDLISRAMMPWRAGSGRPDVAPVIYNNRTSIASWTAVFYRREVFERVGLLDEAFGSYYEDVDFGLRCALAGIDGEYVAEAVALHAGSATLGAWRAATVRLLTRNHRLLIQKHLGRQLTWPTRCRVIAAQLLWAMLAIRHGQVAAWWNGWREDLPATGKPEDPPRVERFLQESERELYRLQKETGFDWYWRMYFSLFPPG